MSVTVQCEACHANVEYERAKVCCVPGVPYSACYCPDCLAKNSHPMWVLISNTAAMGGLHNTLQEWHDMVADSLVAQGKTSEWFTLEVEKAIKALEEYEPPTEPMTDAGL